MIIRSLIVNNWIVKCLGVYMKINSIKKKTENINYFLSFFCFLQGIRILDLRQKGYCHQNSFHQTLLRPVLPVHNLRLRRNFHQYLP